MDIPVGTKAFSPGLITIFFSINAKKKLNEKNCDWVIANDISDKTVGFESDFNKISIFYKDKPEENFEKMSKSLVAEEIVKRIIQQIN